MISFMTVACAALNISINTSTVYFGSQWIRDSQDSFSGHIALIVAIDTAFRILITHVLDALKIPYHPTGTAGHLLFPSLTLLTQYLSVSFAKRFVIQNTTLGNRRFDFIRVFGYIALGWKANMMIKDIVYIAFPSLNLTLNKEIS